MRHHAFVVRIGVVIAIMVLALTAIGAGLVVARPTTSGASSVDSGVTIQCRPSTGVTDGCLSWGDAILGDGAPSHTFEMDDLARLELDRALLGVGDTCTATYFIERYPDDPVWTEEVPCAGR